MKITSDIYQVGGAGLSYSSDASCWLICSADEAALIDSGTGKGTKKLIENIKSAGFDPCNLKYLFITHCHYDHSGGINDVRELTGCKTVAHKLDACYIEQGDSEVTAASWYGTYMKPSKIDIVVNERFTEFSVGDLIIKFYHTPGHSPGSSVMTVLSDNKLVLFGQDVHGPLDSSLLSNRTDYRASLEFLLTLDADILCEGHFGVFRGKENVRKFIRSYL